MSMYGKFKGDSALEKEGIWLEYGDFRLKVARAGGDNKAYAKALEREFKPLRRQFETGTLDNKQALAMLHKVFAETVVLDWNVKQGDDWVRGVEDPASGEIVTPTAEVYVRVFKEAPELFMDIKDQAERLVNFQREEKESEAGN